MRTGRVTDSSSQACRAISPPCSGAAHRSSSKSASATASSSRTRRSPNTLAAQNVDNVRIYHHDAVEVLEREIAPESLAEVRIYFPDPWPKKRHQKRRLIQPDFVALVASRLMRGGRLHLATDWADYAEHMQSVLDHAPDWRRHAEHAAPASRPAWRIDTHFERRGQKLGHGVWDLIYDRI